MPTKKKEGANGFGVTVIFILSVVVLILLFILFTRDQGAKVVETAISNLVETNTELQKEQQTEKQKSLADRLSAAEIDPTNMWEMKPCDQEPYCMFSQLNTGSDTTVAIRGLQRWDGYYESYKDETGNCDALVFVNDIRRGVNLEVLSKLEQKLLKESSKDEPVGLTVFVHDDKAIEHPCDQAPYALNVHFE